MFSNNLRKLLFINNKNIKNLNYICKFNYGKNLTDCPVLGHQLATVRQPAPKFTGMAYWNGKFKKISLEDFKDKWVVLFFYPLDNTFVCPTEIVAFNDNADKFENLNAQVISCSIDSHFSHREWANKPREEGGLKPMKIPMLADVSHAISARYGVRINDENDDSTGISMRGTFIIDTKGVIRHMSINDLPVGRSVDEVIRTLKAFQFVEKHGEVCPAEWNEGKKTIPVAKEDKIKDFWKNEHGKKH